MLVKNCKLVVENNQEIIRDILIEDGVITKIDENIQVDGHEIVDAQSNYVLPGIIDVHTHMRDPGLTHKEDFTSGSKACARGGVTTFIDMPNTIPVTVTEKALMDKKDMMVGRSYVDYGFHFGGSKKDNSEEIKKVLDKVASTKIFLNMSTGDMLIENEKVVENIFRESKIISVHAEEGMVERAIEFCKKYDKELYLCHLSKASEIELLKQAKAEGVKVFGEVTPHHLFLNVDDVNATERSKMLLRMKPELKEKSDNEALWKALADGTLDSIGTDHAPHLIEEKLAKLTYGVPSVENSLEMMLNGVKENKITFERLIEVMCKNPAKIFKIKNKGDIAVGYDGDLVIVDINDNSPIKDDKVITKANWTPFENCNRGGRVLTTILRGEIVYNKGNFNGIHGREVKYYE
ncbi:amidohydrolase family protein [uncultured Fusobacterium sp.]|uniref:dihydroorotase n=1 Tax=uncultured Fusobacterium sp. TaxID=159267 RepID=UPI0025EDBDA3|nr:amidohydrolase family protein [uncultured Fusobacterium sp.]MCF2639616.1 amidohydrolase family protein [Fusobacterium varium]